MPSPSNILDILRQAIVNVGAPPQQGTDNWQDPGFAATQAVSRFTQTPVLIHGQNLVGDQSFAGPDNDPVTGRMSVNRWGNDPQIGAYTTPSATYPQLQSVLAHEQIHALLNRMFAGADPNARDAPWAAAMPDWGVTKPGSGDWNQTVWDQSSRGGDMQAEMPAYMGASPQNLKGITQKDVDDWNKELRSKLPKPVADLLQRIILSAQAVPKFTP